MKDPPLYRRPCVNHRTEIILAGMYIEKTVGVERITPPAVSTERLDAAFATSPNQGDRNELEHH
jgi:hypothetical protein